MTHPKVPRSPRRPLPPPQEHDIVSWQGQLVRVMRTQGPHLVAWNRLREAGPIPQMRWEPHPSGDIAAHPGCGVSYQAADLTTAVAEVFQASRRIDPQTHAPAACFWTPLRPLRLLDLAGTWPLRAGAAAALMSAPRPTCCTWARAIRCDMPDVDGLRTRSTMTGADVVVLFDPAADAFGSSPTAQVRLDSDEGLAVLEAIAARIGYSFG